MLLSESDLFVTFVYSKISKRRKFMLQGLITGLAKEIEKRYTK